MSTTETVKRLMDVEREVQLRIDRVRKERLQLQKKAEVDAESKIQAVKRGYESELKQREANSKDEIERLKVETDKETAKRVQEVRRVVAEKEQDVVNDIVAVVLGLPADGKAKK